MDIEWSPYLDKLTILSMLPDEAKQSNEFQKKKKRKEASSLYELVQLA